MFFYFFFIWNNINGQNGKYRFHLHKWVFFCLCDTGESNLSITILLHSHTLPVAFHNSPVSFHNEVAQVPHRISHPGSRAGRQSSRHTESWMCVGSPLTQQRDKYLPTLVWRNWCVLLRKWLFCDCAWLLYKKFWQKPCWSWPLICDHRNLTRIHVEISTKSEHEQETYRVHKIGPDARLDKTQFSWLQMSPWVEAGQLILQRYC